MTAEEFRNRPRLMEKRIRCMTEKLEELKAAAGSCTLVYGVEMVCHSRTLDTMQKNVYRIMAAEEHLASEIRQLERAKSEIKTALRRIGDPEIESVLEAICLNGLSMGKTAERLAISKHAVWNRYHRGVDMIENMIREEQYA